MISSSRGNSYLVGFWRGGARARNALYSGQERRRQDRRCIPVGAMLAARARKGWPLPLLAAAVHLTPRALVDRAQARFADAAPAALQGAVYAGLVLLLCGATLDTSAFIYFQF